MSRECFEMKTEFSAFQDGPPVDNELEQIIESAIDGAKNGRAVDVEQLAAEHPQYAEQLRTLLPTMDMLMRMGKGTPARGTVKDEVRLGIGRQEQLGDFRLLREIGRG